MLLLATVIILLTTLTFLWLHRPRRPPKHPPGPPTFLFLGNVQFALSAIKGNFLETLMQHRKQYGDIMSIVLPNGEHVVHLMNYEDIKEAGGRAEFAGRPSGVGLQLRSYLKKLGIIFNDGPAWTEHRRFALRHLRDLGFGKNSMEQVVLDECEHLFNEMKQDISEPMKVNFRFNLSVLNVLWRLVASKQLVRDNPEDQAKVGIVNQFFRVVGPQNPMNIAPWIRYLFPKWSGYEALVEHREVTTGMFRELVQQHRDTLDPAAPRDFIDAFLLEMQRSDAAERHFTDLNLSIIGMDLFIAGMETTSTTLSWALLFMVRHPEVQQRVQREIDEVLGDRHPSYADRTQMPYTEATLMEIGRLASVVPAAVPHQATTDAQLGPYTIQKDTVVLMHLRAVHMDPGYWGDPENFRPERFLNTDGSVRREERLIPFGTGKRFCLGETLARMEMFMFFTYLLQRFTFSIPEGHPRPTIETNFTVVLQPKEFYVTYKLRR